MNGADCIAQYRNYVNYRDGEPARKAVAAELREAARIVRERKAEEVRGRKDAKEAEKARRALLTPAELKEENRLKRVANKIAKLAARVNENAPEQVAAAMPGGIESDDERDELFADHEIDDITENARAANV